MANFPVFQFDSRAFPLLTEQQSSPFGGVLSDAIAKRLAMANAQKAEGEAPYAGLSSLAGAMSKGAYAANSPIQSLVKTMMNEPAWYNMSESQQRNAINAVINNAQNQAGISPIFNNLINKELARLQNNQGNQGNQGGSFLERIGQAMTGNTATPNVASSAPNFQTGGLGATNNAPNQEWPVLPQDRGDQPRTLSNVTNAKKNVSEATAFGGAIGAYSAKQLENVQTASGNAFRMHNNVRSAISNYEKSYLKGPILGGAATWGPEAAQVVKDVNAISIDNAHRLYGGDTSNAKDARADTLKLGMKDPPKAFRKVAEKIEAESEREMQMGKFFQIMTAPNVGITDPYEREQIWQKYNNKYPPYDYKNHRRIVSNAHIDDEKALRFIVDEHKKRNTLGTGLENTIRETNAEEEKEFVGNKGKPVKIFKAKDAEDYLNNNRAAEKKIKIGEQWYVKFANGKWHPEY